MQQKDRHVDFATARATLIVSRFAKPSFLNPLMSGVRGASGSAHTRLKDSIKDSRRTNK